MNLTRKFLKVSAVACGMTAAVALLNPAFASASVANVFGVAYVPDPVKELTIGALAGTAYFTADLLPRKA